MWGPPCECWEGRFKRGQGRFWNRPTWGVQDLEWGMVWEIVGIFVIEWDMLDYIRISWTKMGYDLWSDCWLQPLTISCISPSKWDDAPHWYFFKGLNVPTFDQYSYPDCQWLPHSVRHWNAGQFVAFALTCFSWLPVWDIEKRAPIQQTQVPHYL